MAHGRAGTADEGRITSNRNKLGGSPCLAGTRIPTLVIWRWWEGGTPIDDICGQNIYPWLTRTDVLAALAFEWGRRRRKLPET